MHYFKLLGNDHRQLWENREALDKYLARLKELMEQDEPDSLPVKKDEEGVNSPDAEVDKKRGPEQKSRPFDI